MLDTPILIHHDAELTAIVPVTVPRDQIGDAMGPAIAEVLAAIRRSGQSPTGPCYAWFKRRPGDIFDFEVGFPVAQRISPSGRARMSGLPAGQVARALYSGGYDGLADAWGEFCAWANKEHLALRGDLWETYLIGPAHSGDPATWRTALNLPLAAPADAPVVDVSAG